ncbi:MAG: FAD-dependent oxidoreductase [Ardenticatenaceae bacterium]|nr:FAD-dependent oxidoreductase [Ardenticatenaceae bacterium]MCB9445440.1 FAD-dependent oxidoreductase [Ardenticatenaceae bacterium]
MGLSNNRVVVIGAGIGGLTAASLLLKAGLDVTVLEAHVYPGGSAGTFYHKGYRFDAGATLAGGFAPGGPHFRLAEMLDLDWPIQPVDPAWVVHLPDKSITQWANWEQWRAERQAKLPGTERFWQLQERLAAAAWDVSSRPFPWPPQSFNDWVTLVKAIRPSTLPAIPYLTRTIAGLARTASPELRAFLDAQLLISAQTTADKANALYGSAALDLPRRGVNHVRGGIGSLAKMLADWIAANGGQVLYRQEVVEIVVRNGHAAAVRTNKGLTAEADWLLANLTPWGLVGLLDGDAANGWRQKIETTPATWGAFTLYLGLDAAHLPKNLPDHHQVVVDPSRPLGETNSVFISLSDPNDGQRAPKGMRAATLSTHTAVAPWWELQNRDRAAYEVRRQQYAERMVAAAERAIPGIGQSIRLCLPGTPVTFQRFTRRPQGMVGGFPQESLFRAHGPATGIPNLWLVGDSIFPGQSTAGVTVGGMRVATAVLHQTGH